MIKTNITININAWTFITIFTIITIITSRTIICLIIIIKTITFSTSKYSIMTTSMSITRFSCIRLIYNNTRTLFLTIITIIISFTIMTIIIYKMFITFTFTITFMSSTSITFSMSRTFYFIINLIG